MDSYIVKVQNRGTIRRLNLASGEKQFSYEDFQNRVGSVFQLPASAQFVLTYIDKDGDVITMAGDEDLQDALVVQKLNPLRVTIENLQLGTDDVKASSPVVQNELKSVEVTEQQQQQESIQGEQSPSDAVQVDPVGNAEPVLNSSENPTTPEVRVSTTTDGTPAGAAAVDASSETKPEEAKTTGNKFSVGVDAARRRGGPQTHSGVRCDGCGMLPIAGPRFKSCEKPNYDLCLKCFEASGAEENKYAKIDKLFYRIGYPAYLGRMRELQRAQEGMCRKPDQRQNSAPEADVKNSTAPAPAETENKKSATAENSTGVVHPGVQCDECGMIPIEGPRYKSSARFNYDLCQSCFERSGNNTSEYSRIDEPVVVRRGRPFVMGRARPPFLCQYPGRYVWLLNQMLPILAIDEADAGGKTQAGGSDQPGAEEKTSVAGSDVKVPPPQAESAATENASSETSAPQVDAASVAQQEDKITEGKVDVQAVKGKVVDVPVVFNTGNNDSGTSSGPENQTPVDLEKSVSSVKNDTLNNAGKTAGVDEETVQPPAVAAGVDEEIIEASEGPADGDLTTREGLLAKLATMGFEDPKLNEELLEKNNFDLRKTLDDLCAAEEWDPILGELQEMGFYDANMNRRLMFKNNGSVKRVVKELVQMYKGEKLA